MVQVYFFTFDVKRWIKIWYSFIFIYDGKNSDFLNDNFTYVWFIIRLEYLIRKFRNNQYKLFIFNRNVFLYSIIITQMLVIIFKSPFLFELAFRSTYTFSVGIVNFAWNNIVQYHINCYLNTYIFSCNLKLKL